jgi:GGDEF domain-containing protein
LTGLPNCVQFRIALRNAVAAERACAIALVDLDDFNAINKVSGQMLGDELLVEIGAELDAAVVRCDHAEDCCAAITADGYRNLNTSADACAGITTGELHPFEHVVGLLEARRAGAATRIVRRRLEQDGHMRNPG